MIKISGGVNNKLFIYMWLRSELILLLFLISNFGIFELLVLNCRAAELSEKGI